MKNYVCYHLHSETSLLDSCTNHKLYSDRAAELGQTAIGFSEHGNTYNWIEKKMYANSKGLKFLYECEVYLTEKLTGDEDEHKIRDNYHTILIAKNKAGREELNRLIDMSTKPDHFYYKPRITFDEFFNISDNVIKISACLASPLSKYPSSDNADKDIYEKLLKSYDYYEIQPHLHQDQVKYNQMLHMASKKYNIPLIAGTDTHSLNKYKAECRNILQKAKKIQYTDEDVFDLTYKSYDELVEMFRQQASLPMDIVIEAIENTNVMASMVEDDDLNTDFKYPILYDNEEEVFKNRINRMYKEKIKNGIIKPDPRYKEMVQEEMRVFKKIGMVGFMLFMSELVCWCWDNGIPVGFCRGSVGGSMIAYLTDIIDVNPLTWGTMFSRFANEDRKEIGDIDLDISPSQRQLVYNHIIDEYGSDKTAYVLAIGTISDKGTIDDIGRALADKWRENSKEYQKERLRIAKEYEKVKGNDLAEWSLSQYVWDRLNSIDSNNPYSLDNIKKIKDEFEEDSEATKNKYPELFYYFDGLVGTAVSQSMHPAGIIVSPITLPDNYGTFWNDGKRILNINMEEIHEVSLVKYDLLGLKNIEIIKDCCKLAGIKYPKSHEVNWEDEKVWEHIIDSPVGIFQFESKFAYDSMKKMGCKCVNDLSLVNASIRPSGESYRDKLLDRKWNSNPSEIIDKLLEPNHGFLVFQEDTIKFLTQICGLSGSEADNIRRAIGRKQRDRLEAALPQILEGYCNMSDKDRNIAEEEAKEFLQIIEDSANYQFGYNHSTGYSMIGYMCGYLRYYYPTEFITAYLNNANNDDDINMGTELAKQLGINITNIKFGFSHADYSCDGNIKTIYKGLSSIKHINESVPEELYALKDNNYSTFIDLLADIRNTSCNRKQLDILIKLDFFSDFGEIKELLKQAELFERIYGKKQFAKNKLEELEIPEYIIKKCAAKETEKQYRDFDSLDLLKDICKNYKYQKTSIIDKINYESEHLGYVQITVPKMKDCYYYIQSVENNWATLYQIKTGDILKIKFRKNTWNKNPFYKGQIINVLEINQEKRWSKDADGNWIRIDELEDILSKWSIILIK